MLIIFMHAGIAKNNPSAPNPRITAFKRAKSLDNGISISWYEQTWNKDVLAKKPLKPADFALLKQLGIKSLRLPVAFAYFESQKIPVEKIFSHIDNFVEQCRVYGFRLILDYHGGNLDDNTCVTETAKLVELWTKLTKRYRHVNHDDLFFELYNEPPHMDPQKWKDA
ncbi:MAG: cellulase family glycosylhydrolase, partial [Bacteroidota bacterium]